MFRSLPQYLFSQMIGPFWGLIILLAACQDASMGNQNPPKGDSTQSSKPENKERLSQPDDSAAKPTAGRPPEANYEIKLFSSENGWGYNIQRDGRTLIHQPFIPAVGGHKGFSTPEKARKVANLIVYKLKHKRMPPSVSRQEIDSLDVL
ncbi:MAG: DUF4907 domain-containing protein [Bacteroidia bacterium]|nr:DUF4907 domain-containing protein [Bacteroidia bacterium]